MTPSKHLTGDNQSLSFKGQHVDKIRINFKKSGDEFQDDTLCDDIEPNKIISNKVSPPFAFTCLICLAVLKQSDIMYESKIYTTL